MIASIGGDPTARARRGRQVVQRQSAGSQR
jgi:hypothetical protein